MIYTFGDYQLDDKRRELLHGGAPLNIRPKVFDLLLLLVRQRHQVVTKQELLEQVWAGRFVSDTTLSSSIKELRKLLGDTGKVKAYVKTIHGTGFRFIADVDECADSADPATASPDEPASEPQPVSPDSPPLPAALRGNMDGERKNISAIRCALVDADDLAERIGFEALHQVMQDLFRISQQAVSRYDGQVTQWLSDGFLALFGVPVAHEDHARRALSAAIELRDAANDLWRDSPVGISLGMTSGLSIVSGVPGQPQHCFTASGKVMRLAESLCYQAGSGQVMICNDSYELLRGDIRARRHSGDIAGWTIAQFDTASAGVPRRFRRDLTPLVGRDWELSQLQDKLEQATGGAGQVVSISGFAGIGKSRLLTEFEDSIDSESIEYARINCFPHSRDTPYYVLIQYLRHWCRITDADTAASIEAKLRAALASAGLNHTQSVPLLLQMLGLSSAADGLSQLGNKSQRVKTFDYLRKLFTSATRPCVLAVEDLHWIDDSSSEWLASFIDHVPEHPILVLSTHRPGFDADWLKLPWISAIPLPLLTSNYCRELLNTLPHAARLKESMPELIQLSGGNPFYLGELAMNAMVASQAIPKTIQGVLAARIDQLAVLDKTLLQLAAIIGQSGLLKLLVHLSELAPVDVNGAMLRLQAAELLYTDFREGNERFVFKHSLIQEVAYSNQLDSHRRSVHALVAESTRDAFPEFAATHPEFLAHHYSESHAFAKASRFWQRAASNALARSAFVESMAHAQHGLAALEQIEHPDKLSAIKLVLLRTLGSAQVATQGYGSTDAGQTWNRARELAIKLGDDDLLFRILIGLCNYSLVRSEFSKAFSINRQLFRLARKLSSKNLLIAAKASRGELLLHYGRIDLSKRYLDDCLAMVDSNSQQVLHSRAATVTASGQAAWVYWYLGHEAEALAHARRALDIARKLQQPFALAIALSLSAELHRLREDPSSAAELAREGADIAEQQAYPYWHGSSLVTLGWAKAVSGDPAEGIDTLQHGIKVFHSTGATVQTSSHLGGLADAYRVAGQSNRALATTHDAIDWARRTGDKHRLPQLLRLQNSLRQQLQHSPASSTDA